MASYPLVENIYVMWLCQTCSLETFQDGNRVTLLLFFLDHVCKIRETLSGCGWYKDSVFTLLLPNPRASAGPCQSSQFAVCWAKPWDLWQIQEACQSRVWIYLTGSSLEENWFTSAHSCSESILGERERGTGTGRGTGRGTHITVTVAMWIQWQNLCSQTVLSSSSDYSLTPFWIVQS